MQHQDTPIIKLLSITHCGPYWTNSTVSGCQSAWHALKHTWVIDLQEPNCCHSEFKLKENWDWSLELSVVTFTEANVLVSYHGSTSIVSDTTRHSSFGLSLIVDFLSPFSLYFTCSPTLFSHFYFYLISSYFIIISSLLSLWIFSRFFFPPCLISSLFLSSDEHKSSSLLLAI